MINLDFISRNLEMEMDSIYSMKNQNKSGKDFSQILENQKKGSERIKTADAGEKNMIKKPIKLNKDSKYKVEEKPLDENDELELLEEVDVELLSLLQSLYNLVGNLELDPSELDNFNLEILELKLEEISNFLNENTIEINQDTIVLQEENLIEIIDELEEILQSIDKNLEKYEVMDLEIPVEIPDKENLDELKDILNQIKLTLKDNEKLPTEFSIKLEDEFENSIREIETKSLETEEDTENNSTLIKKAEVKELDIPLEEDFYLEKKDLESFISSFEIKNENRMKEMPSIEFKEIQDINPKDLIYQISNKAKIILDDYKQEIKISLKPEILGELILKMETEKGNLLAKIMVDNYRTKELIEANLYQLKQDMKENGLEIKTFEVFVGSNEDFQREKNPEFYLNKKAKKIKTKDIEIEEIKTYDENVFQRTEDIYNGESKLNLLA